MVTLVARKGGSLKRLYVTTMMRVVGRAMQAMSQVDGEIQREVSKLPEGLTIQMSVVTGTPKILLETAPRGRLKYRVSDSGGKPDLNIIFKHLEHAYLVFSFQESTTRSVANDRMIIDGDVRGAMRVVRCLNRLECHILPKFLAARAVKRYPANLSPGDKVFRGTRVYLQMVADLARRGVV